MKHKTKITIFFIFFVLRSLSVFPQSGYNYYYGNIHSHSGYSDGNADSILKTPYEDYNYAKQSLHFDFLGISDHNHALTREKFRRALAEADSASEDGSFVCLYGYEWGHYYDSGHVVVYGHDSLIGWINGRYDIYNAEQDYAGLFSKIAAKPGAFAMLAHPRTNNCFGNIANIPYNEVWNNAITGMPFRNGPGHSTDTGYSDPPIKNYLTFYNKMLKRGYHTGIHLEHDNHNTNFGRTTQGRMVVLAPSLTKNDIFDAIKNRRFYGSDDWNVKVEFTINDYPMGSIIPYEKLPYISVSVTDPDINDDVKSIKIFYGVSGSNNPLKLLAYTNKSSTFSYTDSSACGNMYYYAHITQNDGNEIITSPIWTEVITGSGLNQSENTKFDIFPNPSTNEISFLYKLNAPSQVLLEVMNAAGDKTKVLLNDIQTPENCVLNFNSKDLPEKGLYIARISVNNAVSCKKFIVK